jgi:hypothetical protein
MADFFKGLAGGFGTGLQLGQALRQRRQEDELAKAYAKPEEFTDYTPAQMQEIQRLQSSGAYDVQAIPGAEGAVPTLRFAPRQGIELGQGEMLAAPTEIAPQRVQRYGTQTVAGQFDPTVLRGLQMREAAGVLGRYGDVRGAAALEAQAEEQAYQAQKRPLELAQLKQQGELTGLQLSRSKRDEEAAQRLDNFSAFAAERPEATVAELKEAAFKQFKFTPEQWQKTVTTRLGIENAEMDSFKNNIKKKLQGKNLAQLGSLYNTDPDFDDKTDLAIVPGKGGAVTLNFIDKATGRVSGSQSFKSEALATEYLNKQATEPETVGSWMLNLRKVESAIEAQGAATEASRASAGLTNERRNALKKDSDTLARLDAIDQQIEALTPEEAAGPKGRGLLIQRNAIAAGTNKQVTVSAAGRADRPALSESEATARAKAMVETREINPATKKPYTFNAALDVVKGTAPADPADALIAAMRKNAPAAPGATPAGQQLIGLSNAMLPPAPVPRTQPTTSQERLRGLYLGQ